MITHVIYLSYTGMTDTLGESQVLTYLSGLTARGNLRFHIVSAEKKDLYARHRSRIETYCREAGLQWHPVMYHKRPPVISTIRDHLALQNRAVQLCKDYRIALVHCRGYLPMLSGMAVKRKFGLPLIFDMRGFWPDEKLESGAWSSALYQPIYRYFKRKERAFFREADRVVSLTHGGKQAIVDHGWCRADKIGVIPTCVNFDNFGAFSPETRRRVRERLDIPQSARVLLYSGSLGGNYDMDIPFAFFRAYQKVNPESYFLILSRSAPETVDRYLDSAGIDRAAVRLTSVPFPEVSDHLMAGDAGIVFYGPGFSNKGRSPTKLGEYWASGMPAITLPDIGDVDRIIERFPGSGVVTRSLDAADLEEAVGELGATADRERLREYAIEYYSLDKGIAFYADLYNSILSE